MTSKPSPIVILLPAEQMTQEQVRAFFEARHRALIVEDDWICQHFKFSRRARGKFVSDKPPSSQLGIDKSE